MLVQPFEGALGATPFAPTNAAEGETPGAAGLTPNTLAGDAISRMLPPWLSGAMGGNPMQTAAFGPLAGLIQQLMQMLQWMMGYGGSQYGGGCGGGTPGPERYFANATGASQGDPHLSFNGQHWNSMTSQPDLLQSDSIPGGFRVSTQVGTPNAKGVTWNQSATVSLDGGATTITMDNTGNPTVERNGREIPIMPGQTIQLGNGASVTRNANGALAVTAQNGQGGQIETTLTAQGQGVNVNVSAQNVDLGGALVNGANHVPIPVDPPGGVPQLPNPFRFPPIEMPQPMPIPTFPIE